MGIEDLSLEQLEVLMGGSEAIGRQEKRGQRDLVSTFTRLPREGMDTLRPIFEGLGFVFGENEDELFVKVTAPAGWSLKPTEHPMHSDILDDKGRRRGGVFYKSAYYDRKADVHLARRYHIENDYESRESLNQRCVVKDQATGEVLKAYPYIDGGQYTECDAQRQEAVAWLREKYPDFESVTAYWE